MDTLPVSRRTLSRTRTVRVGVCQILVIDGDREGNFRRIEYALKSACTEGANIVVFPESSILGWENPDAHRLATPLPGIDSERISDLAEKYDVMIGIGLDEKDNGCLYDSAILVSRKGRLLWKHRKLNVLPELMEPPYSKGSMDGIGAVDTEFGRIGMLVCADTFRDEYAEVMSRARPDLVLVPYGWAARTDKWPGHAQELEQLVRRRAMGWKCPVAAADCVGVMMHGPWKGWTFGGASLVVDASGSVLALLRDRDVDVRVISVELGNGNAGGCRDGAAVASDNC